MTKTWKQIMRGILALGLVGSMALVSGCGGGGNNNVYPYTTLFTTTGTFAAPAGVVGVAGGADVAVAPADLGVTTAITAGTTLHDGAAGGGALVVGPIFSIVSVSTSASDLTAIQFAAIPAGSVLGELVDVTLTNAAGQAVKSFTGGALKIGFPVPSGAATVDFYFFDPATGTWTEKQTVPVVGGVATVSVTHLSRYAYFNKKLTGTGI